MKSATWIAALAAALLWSPSVHAGSTTLWLTAPTLNTDGSPLTDLASFRIYAGCHESGTYELAPVTIEDPGATSYVYEGLPNDTVCYFVGTALNTSGVESGYSNEITRTIPPLDGVAPGAPSIRVTWAESGEHAVMPAFDAASTGGGSGNAATITATHTASGTDRAVVVSIAYFSAVTISGVDYGGTAMTHLRTETHDGLNRKVISKWGLINPPTGAQTVTATLSGNSFDRFMHVKSFTGAHQTTAFGTVVHATGTSTAPSVVASSATDELVTDAVYAWSGQTATPTVGAGQTERASQAVGVNGAVLADSTEPGAASVTMSWTLDTSAEWAMLAVPLLPADAGTTVNVGQVTETDTAQAIAGAKQRAVSAVTETDLSQSISTAKARAVGLVTEVDTASAVASRKTSTLGFVTETDLAQALAGALSVQLGQVTEADLAQAVASAKQRILQQILESDVAQAIQAATGIVLGQVTETDTVTALGASKQKSIAQVAEVDSVFAIGVQRVLSLLQVAETDTVFALSIDKLKALGLVTELDVAFAMTVVGGNAIGPINNPGIISGSPARGFTSATVRRGFTKH